VDVVDEVEGAAGFDSPGADGGVKSDTGSSTWAGCGGFNISSTYLCEQHTVFDADQFVDETLIGELCEQRRYHVHTTVQNNEGVNLLWRC